MAGSFIVLNGDVTVKFEYTSTQEKILTTITDAAHFLWVVGWGDHGTEEVPIEFGNLTSQQKLDVVDAYIRKTILDMAKTYTSVFAQDEARILAEQESADHHI